VKRKSTEKKTMTLKATKGDNSRENKIFLKLTIVAKKLNTNDKSGFNGGL